jgi:hypothetical protein
VTTLQPATGFHVASVHSIAVPPSESVPVYCVLTTHGHRAVAPVSRSLRLARRSMRLRVPIMWRPPTPRSDASTFDARPPYRSAQLADGSRGDKFEWSGWPMRGIEPADEAWPSDFCVLGKEPDKVRSRHVAAIGARWGFPFALPWRDPLSRARRVTEGHCRFGRKPPMKSGTISFKISHAPLPLDRWRPSTE